MFDQTYDPNASPMAAMWQQRYAAAQQIVAACNSPEHSLQPKNLTLLQPVNGRFSDKNLYITPTGSSVFVTNLPNRIFFNRATRQMTVRTLPTTLFAAVSMFVPGANSTEGPTHRLATDDEIRAFHQQQAEERKRIARANAALHGGATIFSPEQEKVDVA